MLHQKREQNSGFFFWFSLLQNSHVHWLQYPDLAPDSEGNATHRSLLTQCPMTAPPCHFNALIKNRNTARSYCGDLCSLHENKRKYVPVLLLNHFKHYCANHWCQRWSHKMGANLEKATKFRKNRERKIPISEDRLASPLNYNWQPVQMDAVSIQSYCCVLSLNLANLFPENYTLQLQLLSLVRYF